MKIKKDEFNNTKIYRTVDSLIFEKFMMKYITSDFIPFESYDIFERFMKKRYP